MPAGGHARPTRHVGVVVGGWFDRGCANAILATRRELLPYIFGRPASVIRQQFSGIWDGM